MIDFNKIQSSPDFLDFIKQEKILVLFIHGLGGGVKTWNRFSRILNDDQDLYNLISYSYYYYPTGFWKWPWKNYPSIITISDGLNTEIRHRWKNYNHIILVCHSMGGLIAKKCIVDQIRRKSSEVFRVKSCLFYATPHLGSQLANIGNMFNPFHRQIINLARNSDFVEQINTDWLDFGISRELSSTFIVGGLDNVVDKASAVQFYGNPFVEVIPSCTHKNIIRPYSNTNLNYLIFKNELLRFFNLLLAKDSHDDEPTPLEDELYNEEEQD